MTLLPTLALLVLTAEPLQVRVLEREKPQALTLTAERLECDAAPLPSPAELTVGADGIAVKGRAAGRCATVSSPGPSTVTVGELTRRYPGTLAVSVEGGLLRLINTVDVEAYLPSVVQAELSGGAPAALEAQAIVSRTFALTGRNRHARAGHHLCDLTHCQWYRGAEADAAAVAAVKKTQGQVLMVGGIALKPAFFHSSCGGHTSTASDIFHEAGAGPAIKDTTKEGSACRAAPDFEWSWQADRVELAKALGAKPEGDAFVPLSRDKGGRVLEVSAFGKRMDGGEFSSRIGRAFGWQALRSLKVTAEEVENTVTFKGTGLGHGVGLCQHGAMALAAKGWDAKRLLQRYFPDCQVRQVEE
ncbi:MAG: SpoIID/LytB domain-containing protein [Myxococcus sp.]|nr:SpoIID/LytB domain-containing protein [Myxococcus sp.]